MVLQEYRLIAVLLLLTAASVPLFAQTGTTQPTTAELQQEIRELQKQLDALKAKRSEERRVGKECRL